jgi:mRNA interferase RelE/StbE
MPAESLIVSNKADKQLQKLPNNIQRRITIAFDKLMEDPLSGIKLHGELSSYLKFRIGDYRVVYRFDHNLKTIIVAKIEHRQGVYK